MALFHKDLKGRATLTAFPDPLGRQHVFTLEREAGGSWYPVESSPVTSSDYTFRLPGATRTYRVVVRDLPSGIFYLGYSAAVTVVAVG